jgi:hypothetical protein
MMAICSDILHTAICRITDINLMLILLQLHAALLGSVLLYLGFIQMALSGIGRDDQNELHDRYSVLFSSRMLSLIRIVTVLCTAGALVTLSNILYPNAALGVVSVLLLASVLLGICRIALGIARHFLISSQLKRDSRQDIE